MRSKNLSYGVNLRLSIIMEQFWVSWGYDSNFMAQDRTRVSLEANNIMKNNPQKLSAYRPPKSPQSIVPTSLKLSTAH